MQTLYYECHASVQFLDASQLDVGDDEKHHCQTQQRHLIAPQVPRRLKRNALFHQVRITIVTAKQTVYNNNKTLQYANEVLQKLAHTNNFEMMNFTYLDINTVII